MISSASPYRQCMNSSKEYASADEAKRRGFTDDSFSARCISRFDPRGAGAGGGEGGRGGRQGFRV